METSTQSNLSAHPGPGQVFRPEELPREFPDTENTPFACLWLDGREIWLYDPN